MSFQLSRWPSSPLKSPLMWWSIVLQRFVSRSFRGSMVIGPECACAQQRRSNHRWYCSPRVLCVDVPDRLLACARWTCHSPKAPCTVQAARLSSLRFSPLPQPQYPPFLCSTQRQHPPSAKGNGKIVLPRTKRARETQSAPEPDFSMYREQSPYMSGSHMLLPHGKWLRGALISCRLEQQQSLR